MSLNDASLRASTQIVQAAQNSPPLRRGASGSGVLLLQAALLDLGYRMPVSTRKTGKPDGKYGQETSDVVAQFQNSNGLEPDGVAGRKTIKRLDEKLTAGNTAGPAVVAPPKVANPKPAEYKLGHEDPRVPLDKLRSHGICSKTLRGWFIWRALMDEMRGGGGAVRLMFGLDAARSLHHYLENTGTPFEVRFRQLVAENMTATRHYEKEVQQARRFVEQLPLGTHAITSVRSNVSTAYDSHNWALTVGGFQAWGKGAAKVTEDDVGRIYELNFEYKFKDRYNFDGQNSSQGKGWSLVKIPVNLGRIDFPFMEGDVRIAGDELEVRDSLLRRLHDEGWAKDFVTHGSFSKALRWRHGRPVPWEQYDPRRP